MNKYYVSAGLVGLAVLVAAPVQAGVPALGSTSTYVLLSAATGSRGAVTCTDASIVGNIGSSGAMPAVVKTRCSHQGLTVAPVSNRVLADFNAAYTTLQNTPCRRMLTGTLAGITLSPGVYCFDSGAALTGTLTLNGPSTATWIFLVNGDLTGNTFTTLMAGGGKACNVYWGPSGATTMTTSNLKGNVLAGAAVTLTNGSFNGRAFSTNGMTATGVAVTGCATSRR